MASSSIFTLPVPAYRQSKAPFKHSSHVRKRKRTDTANDDDTKSTDKFSDIDQPQHVHRRDGSQFSEYSAVLTPQERSQYRIAGQSFDQNPPPEPFPHAPQSKLDDPPDTPHRASQRLAELDPPICAPSTDTRYVPLHQQHLGALTALLHRALSRGDFARAGRALGLILRSEVGGQLLDIRAEGRWGIGAEILLRRGSRIGHPKESSAAGADDVGNLGKSERDRVSWVTRKGVEDAKKYYERLIVQYPFHKANPGAVNALDFYPAMFGLWIYVVQEESQLDNGPSEDSTLSETSHPEDWALPETPTPVDLTSKRRTLAQAREIALRMDSCMNTIPYSDHVELIRLRGMVAQWIADLIDDIIGSRDSSYDETEDGLGQNEVLAAGLTRRSPLQGHADDLHRALRLEAHRAKEMVVEMQQKIQGRRDGLV